MRKRPHTAALLVLVMATGPCALTAQQVRGVVRDSASGLPVPGAVVSILAGSGAPAARTIADQQGRFRLPRPPTIVRLRVQRLGFRPREMVLGRATPGDDVELAIGVVALPSLLEAVTVIDRPSCPARPDRKQAAALWEQAQAALLTAVVARSANPAQMRLLVYDRQLDAHGRRIFTQRVHSETGATTRPFRATNSAATFAARGYVQETWQGDIARREYQGPDADVLLDESFAATHCFHVAAADADHPGQVGLVFVPLHDDHEIADVTGVLWLDLSPPVLRRLEFKYTALEPAAMAAGAGGFLDFRTMPNGVVFVERWNIRMPGFGQPTARHIDAGAHVSSLADAGGVVATAEWPDGLRWQATLGRIQGVVVERNGGAAMPAVRVWLEGAEESTVTDSSGTFQFDGLLAGPYTIRAADSSLAAFDLGQNKSKDLELHDGGTIEVTLQLQSRKEAVTAACGTGIGVGRGILLGRVMTAQGEPAVGATIDARWWDFGNLARVSGVEVDREARFRICNLPLDQQVFLQVRHPTVRVLDTAVRLSRAAGISGVTLLLGPVSHSDPANAGALWGSVRFDSAGSHGISDAEVQLPELGVSAQTDFFGEYKLPGLAPGQHLVVVRAPGFLTFSDSVLIPPAGDARLVVMLVRQR